MKKSRLNYLIFLLMITVLNSCVTKPPENPDNICLIFKEKKKVVQSRN